MLLNPWDYIRRSGKSPAEQALEDAEGYLDATDTTARDTRWTLNVGNNTSIDVTLADKIGLADDQLRNYIHGVQVHETITIYGVAVVGYGNRVEFGPLRKRSSSLSEVDKALLLNFDRAKQEFYEAKMG